MLSVGFQWGIIQTAERLLFSLHWESQLCNYHRPHINWSVRMTKTSAKIWIAPLFSLLCPRARPDLTRVNAETVKSLLLIVLLHAWLSNLKSETWIILDSTGPGKNNWQFMFWKSLIDEGKLTKATLLPPSSHFVKFESGSNANDDVFNLPLTTSKYAQAQKSLYLLNSVPVEDWLGFIALQSPLFPQLNKF